MEPKHIKSSSNQPVENSESNNKNQQPQRVKLEKIVNNDLNYPQAKKVVKLPLEPFTKQTKLSPSSIAKKNTLEINVDKVFDKNVLKTISSTKSNRDLSKHVPINNPNPNSYTSILKNPKNSYEEQTKKVKVVFDENLNSEHFLTNSDISSNQSVIEKRDLATAETPKNKTKQKKDLSSYFLNDPKIVSNNNNNNSSFTGISENDQNINTEAFSKPKQIITTNQKELPKTDQEIKNMQMNQFDISKSPYTPIKELGFTNKIETSDSKFSGFQLDLNSDAFYQTVLKECENKSDVIKYAQLPIELWLQRGEDLNSERSKIINQIMSIRIRSSYAHQILTEHLNARADALQKWETNQQSNESVFAQIQNFLNNKP
ncbi:hypothetical protein HANVADRAFT_4232 [Hanseniaspora valbyensis NRRL Y-1626]|uniref:Extracellular mutant protein 11 C-terminal domain-containing protein n=1 Tax=Hanseniaspora valbyensis NRRL Y-1626 TaxID=766949 RepID=A0A1B7T8B2_9ASCO|nr:hypothetical protein HANVADRAFT_4232 [Hanseniaspora valbyensis NRRL Y-1626]